MDKNKRNGEQIWAILMLVMFIGTLGLSAFGKISSAAYSHTMAFAFGVIFYQKVISDEEKE